MTNEETNSISKIMNDLHKEHKEQKKQQLDARIEKIKKEAVKGK